MVDGATIGHEAELEILRQRRLVEITGPASRTQRTDGRGEGDAAVSRGIYQGFDPQAIANEVERAIRVVPQPKREHPSQTGDQTLDSPPTVSMQQHFGVGATTELRAVGGQLRSQSAEVVDRAIEDEPQGSVGRHHRLPPRVAEVEDGEPPVTEHDPRPTLDTLAIRPSPGQRVSHVLHPLQRQGRVLEPDYASNPAHTECQRSLRPRKTKWELNQGCSAPPRLRKMR